jgi:hypothetical protein
VLNWQGNFSLAFLSQVAYNCNCTIDLESSVKNFRPVIVNGRVVAGYFVNRSGMILSHKQKVRKFMKPLTCKTRRYPFVGLQINGKSRLTMVHRIVCESFVPYPTSYPGISSSEWKATPNSVKSVLMKSMEVNHKNGNILDYRLSNLEWTTAEENVNHYYETRVRCKR